MGTPPRYYTTIACLVLGLVLIIWRLFTLQVVQARDLAHKAERQHQKSVQLEAERGQILDRNGTILATNTDVPSIYAVPPMVADPTQTARRLAKTVSADPRALARRLNADRGFVWIARKTDPNSAQTIKALNLPGIGFVNESQRFYPQRLLLGHILGFTGIDNEGLEGLELKYNSVLKGARGSMVVTRDALGRPIFQQERRQQPSARGSDLVLTIDERIQHVAERELGAAMDRSGATAGTIIAMQPQTGEILAMAVRPGFNPNHVESSRPAEWRNRAITDLYEPGSTFKIISSAAALQERVVKPDDVFFCENGALRIAGEIIHDHDKEGYLTFQQIIQKSSNIGMIKVSMRVGSTRLYRYIHDFGFGEKTGVDLKGEASGQVRPLERWSGRSIATIAIGQEVGVTPLQIVTAVAAVANGGWLMRPYLVSAIRGSADSDSVYPLARRRVIDEDTARTLTQILTTTVQKGGTGERAAIPGYAVAGKTGTAQKFDFEARRYSHDSVVSSFVGFAPADDPRIVLLVLLDSPRGVNWGGSVAAPVFRQIVEEVLPYLGVQPSHRERLLLAAG